MIEDDPDSPPTILDSRGSDLELPVRQKFILGRKRRVIISKLIPTWGTLLFTAIVGVAAVFQAYYTRQYTRYAAEQLKAIAKGSEDTKALLQLYKQQADAADRQALAMERNASSTTISAHAAQKSAVAAEKSSNTAEEALERGDRAYVLTCPPEIRPAEM